MDNNLAMLDYADLVMLFCKLNQILPVLRVLSNKALDASASIQEACKPWREQTRFAHS